MFLYLAIFLAIYFTANSPRKMIDGSISTIFPLKEQKEGQEKRRQCRGFPVNFVEFLRTSFFKEQLRCLLLEYEHNKTKLLHMT